MRRECCLGGRDACRLWLTTNKQFSSALLDRAGAPIGPNTCTGENTKVYVTKQNETPSAAHTMIILSCKTSHRINKRS